MTKARNSKRLTVVCLAIVVGLTAWGVQAMKQSPKPKVHDRVDVQHWKSLYPLADLREQARRFVMQRKAEKPAEYPDQKSVQEHIDMMGPQAESITSPYDLAVTELLRDEAISGTVSSSLGKTTPVDVFVFSKGEPKNRAITKIGGLPYWPKARSWPKGEEGKPKTFVAQFCFADSADIAGKLPGDVLLVFGDAQKDVPYGASKNLRFFWEKLGQTNLVGRGDIPKTGGRLTPVYGSICRTVDYDPTAFEKAGVDESLAIVDGTKIGGIPMWIQEPEDLPGRFLCALGSIQPEPERPYPWLNQAKAITSQSYDEGLLMWGDMGTLYLFIDDKGRIHCTWQCY